MAITISGENNNDRILASDGVIDQISGINIVGLITASHINVGSNIQLGNAGIITATTFVGNVTGNVNSTSPLLLQTGGSERFRITGNNELGIAGANYGSSGQVLTSGGSGNAVTWSAIPSQVTIANNADNRVITGGSGTNLNGEANLIYNGTGLGVGETSPANLLHVKVSDAGIAPHPSAQIVLERSGTNYLQFLTAVNGTSGLLFGDTNDIDVAKIVYDHNIPAMQFVTETVEKLRISSGGQVRMNTAGSPSADLHVGGTSAVLNSYFQTSSSTGAYHKYSLGDSGADLGYFGSARQISASGQSAGFAMRSQGHIEFCTGGSTERVRITSDGDVNAATGHLQAQDIKIGLAADRYPIIQRSVQSSGSQNLTITGGSGYSEHTGSDHSLVDARQGAMIQLGAGNPTSDTYGGYIKYFAHGHTSPNAGSAGNAHVFYTRSAANTNTERLRITSDGKVGINDNNPANQLVVKAPGGSGHCSSAVYSGDASTKISMQVVQGSEGRFGMTTNHPLAIYAGALERLRLDSDGAAFFKGVSSGSKATINLESEDPFIRLYDTNGANDRRKWDIRNIGASGYEELDFRTINDANNSFNSVMQIEYGGDVNINDGNLRVASGHGIDFSATSNSGGTMTSELLDQYEEGTFTPVITRSNPSGVSGNYNYQHGVYTRIGRLVHCYIDVDINNFSGGGGHVAMYGLPYTVNSYGLPGWPHMMQMRRMYLDGDYAAGVDAKAIVFTGSHYGYLMNIDDDAWDYGSYTRVIFTGQFTYKVT